MLMMCDSNPSSRPRANFTSRLDWQVYCRPVLPVSSDRQVTHVQQTATPDRIALHTSAHAHRGGSSRASTAPESSLAAGDYRANRVYYSASRARRSPLPPATSRAATRIIATWAAACHVEHQFGVHLSHKITPLPPVENFPADIGLSIVRSFLARRRLLPRSPRAMALSGMLARIGLWT